MPDKLVETRNGPDRGLTQIVLSDVCLAVFVEVGYHDGVMKMDTK